jgi:hypothetical protein
MTNKTKQHKANTDSRQFSIVRLTVKFPQVCFVGLYSLPSRSRRFPPRGIHAGNDAYQRAAMAHG